jgi:hypothetical protein
MHAVHDQIKAHSRPKKQEQTTCASSLSIPGITEGATGGVTEGVTEGITEEMTEGIIDGITDGVTEGVTEGIILRPSGAEQRAKVEVDWEVGVAGRPVLNQNRRFSYDSQKLDCR